MHITVIGAGNIGGTLGKSWQRAGHNLHFGVRNPQDPKFDELRQVGQVTGIAQALPPAEAVLLSLPGSGVEEFASQYGPALAGKLVIDATNNIRSADMGSLGLLREKAPSAILARAFSTLGWEVFANPLMAGQPADLFFCAQPEARPRIDQLISAAGLGPVFLGDLSAAPLLDNLTRVWFALAINQGHGRRVAFKMLKD